MLKLSHVKQQMMWCDPRERLHNPVETLEKGQKSSRCRFWRMSLVHWWNWGNKIFVLWLLNEASDVFNGLLWTLLAQRNRTGHTPTWGFQYFFPPWSVFWTHFYLPTTRWQSCLRHPLVIKLPCNIPQWARSDESLLMVWVQRRQVAMLCSTEEF